MIMAKNPYLLLVVFVLIVSVLHQYQSQSPGSNGFKLKLNRIELQAIRPILTRPNYVFTIDAFIGTPTTKQTFIFDMTCNLIWVQCNPCIRCFKQNYPLFDPKNSTSYVRLSSYQTNLTRFFYPKRDNEGHVTYTYKRLYHIAQMSTGYGAVETLTFPTTKNGRKSIKEMVFGCSIHYEGTFEADKMVSGVMGSDRSPLSLIGQMPKSSRRFSYCLPRLDSATKSTFLIFGKDVKVKWSFKKTSFIRNDKYSVKLLAISVVGQRLNLQRPSRFSYNECRFDVGSSTSELEVKAYTPVLNAIRQHFDRLNLTRHTSLPRDYDPELCYKTKPGFKNNVTMTMHFVGANFEIGPENLFDVRKDPSRFCLFLFPSSENWTVLGAYQQQNMRLVFDQTNERLLFGKENCSKDKR